MRPSRAKRRRGDVEPPDPHRVELLLDRERDERRGLREEEPVALLRPGGFAAGLGLLRQAGAARIAAHASTAPAARGAAPRRPVAVLTRTIIAKEGRSRSRGRRRGAPREDGSAVPLDRAPDRREPHPRAPGLRRERGLEEPLHRVARDPGPVVLADEADARHPSADLLTAPR